MIVMHLAPCSKEDFDQILGDVSDFWDSDRTLHLHLPIFFHEFGNSAFVVKEQGTVKAYLFGFLSQTKSTGYIHLVAVRRADRRKGLATELYRHFSSFAQANRCNALKAITTPSNIVSVKFHEKLGFEATVIPDYAGPGKPRVVFQKTI